MADDSIVKWTQMHSEALLLRAQLYQGLARYDPSLIDELLRACGDSVPASHHNCQLLRTLTDLLLDGPQPNVSKASLLIDRAIRMGHQLYGNLHPMIAFSMMTKGRVLLELDKSEEALIVLMGAQNMNDRLPVEVHEDTIFPLLHFFRGECYIQQCRYAEAYEALQASAVQTKILKVRLGPGHQQNMVVSLARQPFVPISPRLHNGEIGARDYMVALGQIGVGMHSFGAAGGGKAVH